MSNFLVTLQDELKETLITSLPEVIRQLKEALPNGSDKHDAILLVEARLYDAQQKRLANIVSQADLSILYDRLRYDLLQFINDLEVSDFSTTKPVSNNKNGSILYKIPAEMTLGQEERCIIRLAFDLATVKKDIALDQDTRIESIRVSNIMHAVLIDPNTAAAFTIRTYHEKEQFVEKDDYTEWIYFVTPIREGKFPMLLKISVVVKIDDKERLKNIVLEREVSISSQASRQESPSSFTQTAYYFSAPSMPVPAQDKSLDNHFEPFPSPTRSSSNRRARISAFASILMVALAIGFIWPRFSKNSQTPKPVDQIDHPISTPDPGVKPPPPPINTNPKPVQDSSKTSAKLDSLRNPEQD